MAYHPSPELDSLIEALLGSEKKRFFESTAEQLPHTFRFNDLKAPPTLLKSFLEEQQFEFSPFPGFEDVFRMIRQPFPIGKSLSHFLGHIYVQDIYLGYVSSTAISGYDTVIGNFTLEHQYNLMRLHAVIPNLSTWDYVSAQYFQEGKFNISLNYF